MTTETTLLLPDTAPALTPAERLATRLVATATALFAMYGLATGAPSTIGYLCTVALVGGALVALRRSPLPAPLALGLAALTVAHLAGGLVRVGDGVLYNATFGAPALRYDHFVHASGVFLGTLVVWRTVVAPLVPLPTAGLFAVCVLAGLGLGALNEMIEFLSTLAHSGSHVGGYANTGWDLVSNVFGGAAAGLVLRRTVTR